MVTWLAPLVVKRSITTRLTAVVLAFIIDPTTWHDSLTLLHNPLPCLRPQTLSSSLWASTYHDVLYSGVEGWNENRSRSYSRQRQQHSSQDAVVIFLSTSYWRCKPSSPVIYAKYADTIASLSLGYIPGLLVSSVESKYIIDWVIARCSIPSGLFTRRCARKKLTVLAVTDVRIPGLM